MHKGDLYAYKDKKYFPGYPLNGAWAGTVFYAEGPWDSVSIRVVCIAHAKQQPWMKNSHGLYEPPLLGKEYNIRINRLERIWNARTGKAVLTAEELAAFEKSLTEPAPPPKMVEEEYVYDREMV